MNEVGELKCNADACSQLETTTSTVTLTPHAEADSVFSNWGGHEDCVDGEVFMNSGKLCIAYFHRIYDLTVTLQGSGQVLGYGYDQQPVIDCGSKCQTSFSSEMRVSLQAIPGEGMTFGGWSGDCGTSTQNPLTLSVTKDLECLAIFVTPAPPNSEELDISTTVVPVPPVSPTSPVATSSAEVPTTSAVVTTPVTEETSLSADPTLPATGDTSLPVNTIPATEDTSPLESIPPVDLTPPTTPPVVMVTPLPVTASVVVETYYPAMIITTRFDCPTTGDVDDICHYGGREVTQLNVQGHGIVSNGVVSTTVVNTGWVSNFTITATGQLSGGVVTGYTKNFGMMLNFEFRGASIVGGTLGGIIHNTSQIGGYFQNVTLLANTKIIGGRLKGTIRGDKKSKAVLEKVRVLKGSKLSGVKLGKGVVLEKGVVVE